MAARVPLRVEVRDVLNLHRQGRHDEALQRAVNLAATERNRCALVMNLAGNLLLEAHLRDQGSSPHRAREYLHDADKVAAAEAPNCVETAAACVTALVELKLYSEAEMEFVLTLTGSSRDDSALAAAAEVAKRFPFSARAQLLPVFMEVEAVRTLSRDDRKKMKILAWAVKSISDVVNTFPSSLVIAIYHASYWLCLASMKLPKGSATGHFALRNPWIQSSTTFL
ncbi:hypothetical protein C2845_PM02G39050 [Panicum miliaceum]|uniref:DUF627 domain-containing protein n=1 Tax=Panicum miliaceum TaxID=4540 RepID=A0A3L6S7I4_PANMI|nr:hypothetical protein C2845_PM02G39050 [Panicum miliaceum]